MRISPFVVWTGSAALALSLAAACGSGGGAGGSSGGAPAGASGTSASVAGSGGSGGAGRSGGAGAGGGTSRLGGRSFCPGGLTPTPYAGIGDSCGAGSNYALCVLTDSDCDTGLCLWDQADPAKERAYCTIACQPGVTGACPSGYECKKESCTKKDVCVRVQVEVPISPGLEIHDSAFALSARKFAVGTLGDKSYWVASDGTAWEGAADGTAHQLTGALAGTIRDAHGVPDGNSLLVWLITENVYLGRIADRAFTTARWPNSGGSGIFRSESGTVYMLQSSLYDSTFAPITPDLKPSTDMGSYLHPTGLSPYAIVPLRDFGFAGDCLNSDTQLTACASADGRTIVDLGKVDMDSAYIRQSYRPDRIWMGIPGGLVDVSSELAMWNGTAWVKESLQPGYGTLLGESSYNPTVVGVVPLSRTDDRVMVFIGDSIFVMVAYAGKDCYTPIYAVETSYNLPYSLGARTSLLQTGPDTIEWSSNGKNRIVLRTSAFDQAPVR